MKFNIITNRRIGIMQTDSVLAAIKYLSQEKELEDAILRAALSDNIKEIHNLKDNMLTCELGYVFAMYIDEVEEVEI